MRTKTCTKCGKSLPATTEFFNSSPHHKDKLNPLCVVCRRAKRLAEYRAVHGVRDIGPHWRINDAGIRCKSCTKCKQFLPSTAEYFHASARDSTGFAPHCKSCRSKERRERYMLSGDTERAQMLIYASEHSKEAVERATNWGIQHPEKLKEHRRKHRQTHMEQGRVYVRNRQSRLAGADGSHTAEDIRAIFDQQEGLCFYCHITLTKYHVDHVVPISRGGSNSPDNLVIACPHCNDSKGSKLPEEWGRVYEPAPIEEKKLSCYFVAEDPAGIIPAIHEA